MVMDWEDVTVSAGSEEDPDEALTTVSRSLPSKTAEPSLSNSRGSMRGLQLAIAEGWIVQRARDMCTFSHDRYRQAAIAEAQAVPAEQFAMMSFKVGLRSRC